MFSIGDRVNRPVNVFDSKSRLMSGTISKIEYDVPSLFGGTDKIVIAVIWDLCTCNGTGKENHEHYGYFPHGLRRDR